MAGSRYDTDFHVVSTNYWAQAHTDDPNYMRVQPDRLVKKKGNQKLDQIYDVEYTNTRAPTTTHPPSAQTDRAPPTTHPPPAQAEGAPPTTHPPSAQADRDRLNPTPSLPHVTNIHKVKIGHSGFGTGAMSDVSEPTLIDRSEICNLYYQIGNHDEEESMRHHASPVHEQHAFVQLVRMLGPTRPELKPLADFIKFTRKVFQNGKFLRGFVENRDNRYTLKQVEEYHNKATNNLYQLRLLFERMFDFVHLPPSILEQIQFEEVLEQIQVYFDPQTGLHEQFLEPIHYWVGRASQLLSSSKLAETSENNSTLNESFDSITGRVFPDLELTGRGTSDQPATLAPQQFMQGGGGNRYAGRDRYAGEIPEQRPTWP